MSQASLPVLGVHPVQTATMTPTSATSVMPTTTTPIPPPAATTSATGGGGGGGPTSSPLLFFVALGFGVVFTNLWYAYPSRSSNNTIYFDLDLADT